MWDNLRRFARRPMTTFMGGPMNAVMNSMDAMVAGMDAFVGPPMDAMVNGMMNMTNWSRGPSGGDVNERQGDNIKEQSNWSGDSFSGSNSSGELSSDRLKLVDWWVLYTKPGSERVLGQGSESINYSTSESALGGRIIARVLRESGEQLSERDQDEYIEFRSQVRFQAGRRDRNYDSRIADSVERIADELEHRPASAGRAEAGARGRERENKPAA